MIKSIVLLTFYYQGRQRLPSSITDAYHTLQWAHHHHLPVTWYLDHFPSHLYDPIMAAFFATHPPQLMGEVTEILHQVPPYSLVIISGHGHPEGLLLSSSGEDLLPWSHLVTSLRHPDIIMVLDGCHVPSLLPATFQKDRWYLSSVPLIPAPDRCYILTVRHPHGKVISSPGGSPLLNHVLRQRTARHHRWSQWMSDPLPHDLTLVIMSNYTILETLPSWVLTRWHFLYDHNRRIIKGEEI